MFISQAWLAFSVLPCDTCVILFQKDIDPHHPTEMTIMHLWMISDLSLSRFNVMFPLHSDSSIPGCVKFLLVALHKPNLASFFFTFQSICFMSSTQQLKIEWQKCPVSAPLYFYSNFHKLASFLFISHSQHCALNFRKINCCVIILCCCLINTNMYCIRLIKHHSLNNDLWFFPCCI